MSVWFNPAREIDALLRKAAASVPGLEADFNPELKPSDPRHADFQANGILAAAKKAKANPRALATALVEAVRAKVVSTTRSSRWKSPVQASLISSSRPLPSVPGCVNTATNPSGALARPA
jgi:hypothetical protein